ncbi:acetylcholine receptor subunit alpha-like 2 [Amphiura filiformis]|uniref:acetylcholine receptor subunit alpha-like 2 n=1 Tax=Amphiura filiformis TaxID=82378 RepID=UPI003B21295E
MACRWLQLILGSYWIISVSALIVNEYYHTSPIAQSRLIFDLLSKYHESVPPTHEGPVQVEIGFTMSFFDFLDEGHQQACIHMWSSRAWTDPRLRWDPAKYNDTDNILLDIDQIWIPDIELYNGATSLNTVKASAVIQHTGKISYVPSFQINFICDMDLSYFPYDTQTCSLKMGSWHYHSETLNLSLSSAKPDLSHFKRINDFTLLEVKQQRNLRTYPCCQEEYIDVTYSFILKRQSSAYSAKLVLPSVLAGFLVLGTFLVPNTSCERLTLCIVLFLCIVHLLTYLHDIIPTSGESILGCYLAFALFLDFFAIILAIISYNLQRSTRAMQELRGEMENDVDGENELKIRKPPNRKKGFMRFFDFGCFILFAVTFIIGLAVILGRRG